jgi:hypothetical protein
MADKAGGSEPVSVEMDGPDMVMRFNGIIVARLTGEDGKRNVQWMQLDFVHESSKQRRFDELFAKTRQTPEDAKRCAREAGLV